ncbi:hypothetical protein, partial [Neglectibacter timonensis]|uniref:hypothetical protein n=1 Tax=Neglectibacter timonensis TaxID=1776382 RepID=UPI00321B707C
RGIVRGRKPNKRAGRAPGPSISEAPSPAPKEQPRAVLFFVWKKQLENQNHSCFNTLTVRCRYPDITNEKENRLCYNRKQQNRLA